MKSAGSLARLAHFIARRRWVVIGVWIVLMLVGGVAAGKLPERWYQSFSLPGKPAYEASQRTLKAFGVGVRPPNAVVFHTAGDATKSVAIKQAMQRAAATVPGALSSSYFSTHSSMYVSRDRHTAFLEVYPPGSSTLATKSGAAAMRAAAAILSTYTLVWALTYITSVSLVVQFLIALVGLGVAIDYALLMIFRFRDELREGSDVETALVETMSHAGRSVIVSGSTIAVGLLSMIVLPVPFIRSIGIGIAAGIVFDATVIRALLVPALMRLLGNANWWMPNWTRAALRIREGERLPAPATDAA